MSTIFWNKFFIISIILFFILTSLFNFIINPYQLFNHKKNSNFLVIKNHIMSERMQVFYETKYSNANNIIMGSSRIGMLSQSDISKYLGGFTSSMSIAGSNIEEQSQYLLYMIQHKHINNIIWGLDFYSFNPDLPNDSDFTYSRLQNYIFLNSDQQIALLSFQTTKNSFKTLMDNINADTKVKENYKKLLLKNKDNKNRYKHYLSLTKKEVDNRTTIQLNYYPTKFLRVKTFNNPKSIDKNLKKIKMILDICKEKNIKVYVYTSPVSKDFLNLYKKLGLKDTFSYWKNNLQKITSYTDFCTYNNITNNKYNFVDGTHIKPNFSSIIFAKLFHDKSLKDYKDFAQYKELR